MFVRTSRRSLALWWCCLESCFSHWRRSSRCRWRLWTIWRAVRANEECVKVLDLSLVLAGVAPVLVDRYAQRLDGSREVVEGREDLLERLWIRGCDVFLSRRAIWLVFIKGWIQRVSPMFLVAYI